MEATSPSAGTPARSPEPPPATAATASLSPRQPRQPRAWDPIPSLDPAAFPAPLRGIAGKVRDGERLDEADALTCLTTPHLLHLGRLADAVRRQLNGDVTYFNINRHINPTNICVYTYNCKFCSFAALPGEAHAWQMSLEDVYAHAREQGGNDVTEFHIVGGLHPDLSLDWYLEMMRGLKQRFPNVHLKAFTAIEVGWFAKREKLSLEEVLRRMRDAGLGSLPGGGAEIFHPEVREIICDGKLDAGEWIEVHRLAYHPENNYMGLKYHTTGHDDLRHIAASRLVLDNIPHIKAYWVMVTPKLAQVALRFGADDMDGTVVEEKIYHMAGAGTAQQLSRSELERIVREAGFTPVERDTLYNAVTPAAATV